MASLSGKQAMPTVRGVTISNAPQRDSEFQAKRRIARELINATREPIPFVSYRIENDDLVCISFDFLSTG
jgi:hypothetical protein